MKSQRVANIFYGIVLCLLFICSQGIFAEDLDDYVSAFDTSYQDRQNNHSLHKPISYIPRSDETLYSERSFSDLTRSNYEFVIAIDIPDNRSPINRYVKESHTSFREIQNSLPNTLGLDSYKNRPKARIYGQYVSSATESETWLMILVGVTLIGLQVFRGNKRAEPIYSSFN